MAELFKRPQLSDLYFGEIDAKDELCSNDAESRRRFKEAFIVPQNVIEDYFLKGRKFIVYGLKGTGKTALLRFLGLQAEDKGAEIQFVLFRHQIASHEKEFSVPDNTKEIITSGPEPEGQDYEAIWRWLFHRIIVEKVTKTDKALPFEKNDQYEKYKKIVNLVEAEDGTLLSRLLPKIKRGKIEIGFPGGRPTASIGLEMEWIEEKKARVSFSRLVDLADSAFAKLKPSNGKIYIILDELELSVGNKSRYERDIRLIRDLIKSAYDFNSQCIESKLDIHTLIAVRSEVITAIESSGKEINKIVEGFGNQITWNYPGNDPTHPLLEIIAKRINSSEKNGSYPVTPKEEIWSRYFPELIQEIPVREYILHQTWYRPRDIVRLFSGICETNRNDTVFTHAHFDSIRREYSKRVWSEAIEELRTAYSTEDLNSIKQLLTGFRPYFGIKDWDSRIKSLSSVYKNVQSLSERKCTGDVLTDLFRVGVIGNDYVYDADGQRMHSKNRQRWSFRGDSDPLLDKSFAVHRALWATLSLV